MSRPVAGGSVGAALAALATGSMVVVTDDPDREDEGDLVMAAEFVTEAQMAFLIRHTTGIVCTPMSTERANQLELPLMVADNTDAHSTAFTVSVDLAGTGTGVSAAARAATAAALAAPTTRAGMLRRPGHVFPLRAQPGGVLERPGHTEAAVDLLRLAGLSGVGVISELVAEDGSMLRGEAVPAFSTRHRLPTLAIADLIAHRRSAEQLVTAVADCSMPTTWADFRAFAYRSTGDGADHLALVLGDPAAASGTDAGVLVRVHSECLTGDVLHSLRCDCGAQLDRALSAIAAEGCGVLVYLRGHEGRGIGLVRKIRAYALQEGGLDTVDANTAQGLPVDARSYEVAAQVLSDLGVRRIRLMTNNPDKDGALRDRGLDVVSRVSLQTPANVHNLQYLRTKRDRMGHELATDVAQL